MSKINNVFFVIFLFLFFSCSNNQNSIITYQNEDTLKTFITSKGNDTLWTKEIDSTTLLEDIKKNSYVEVKTLSPAVINVVSNQMAEIYPSITNFAHLDTRNLPGDIKDFLDKFYNQISTDIYNPEEGIFSKDFLFSYVFFVDDLKNGWTKYFKTDFPIFEIPEKNDNNSEDNAKNNSEDEGNTKQNVSETQKVKLFSSKIYGEPFSADNYIQIPLRLINEHGKINVIIYMTNTSPYSIFNIEIIGWESKYGE